MRLERHRVLPILCAAGLSLLSSLENGCNTGPIHQLAELPEGARFLRYPLTEEDWRFLLAEQGEMVKNQMSLVGLNEDWQTIVPLKGLERELRSNAQVSRVYKSKFFILEEILKEGKNREQRLSFLWLNTDLNRLYAVSIPSGLMRVIETDDEDPPKIKFKIDLSKFISLERAVIDGTNDYGRIFVLTEYNDPIPYLNASDALIGVEIRGGKKDLGNLSEIR